MLAINARYHVQWLENKAAPGRIETVLETSYRLGSLRAFLSDVSSLSSPILSNQSQDLYTVLRKPTVGAPWAWMVKEPWTAEDIRELAARFGVEYLVIFHRIGPGRDQDFVLRLLDEDPKFLAPLLVTDDVTLYRFVAP